MGTLGNSLEVEEWWPEEHKWENWKFPKQGQLNVVIFCPLPNCSSSCFPSLGCSSSTLYPKSDLWCHQQQPRLNRRIPPSNKISLICVCPSISMATALVKSLIILLWQISHITENSVSAYLIIPFIPQIFIQHLLFIRHWVRLWGNQCEEKKKKRQYFRPYGINSLKRE